MFVAKFSQTNGEPFSSDKNGNMPFIGEVLAGKAKGTLINGTMFHREGLQPNKLYACENVEEEYEGRKQIRVRIIAEVSVIDYPQLRTALGAGKLEVSTSEVPATDSEDAI
jgi:hypothetical protein